jgi:hypothetical protein
LKRSWGVDCLAHMGSTAAELFQMMGQEVFLGRSRMEKDSKLSDKLEASEYIVRMVRFLKEELSALEDLLVLLDKFETAMAVAPPELTKRFKLRIPDRHIPGLPDTTSPISVNNIKEVSDCLRTEFRTKSGSLTSLTYVSQIYKVCCVTYSHILIDLFRSSTPPLLILKSMIQAEIPKSLKGSSTWIEKLPTEEAVDRAFARMTELYPDLEKKATAIKDKYEERRKGAPPKSAPKVQMDPLVLGLREFGRPIVRDAIVMSYALERAIRELESTGNLSGDNDCLDYHRRVYEFYTNPMDADSAGYNGIVARKADSLTEAMKRASVVQDKSVTLHEKQAFYPRRFLDAFRGAPSEITTGTMFFLFVDVVKMMRDVLIKKEQQQDYAITRNKLIKIGNLNAANRIPYPAHSLRATDIELRHVPSSDMDPKNIRNMAMLVKTMFKNEDGLMRAVGSYMFQEVDRIRSGQNGAAVPSANKNYLSNIMKRATTNWTNIS